MRHIRPANQPIEIRNIPKPATVIASGTSTAKAPSTKPAASIPVEKQRTGENTGQKTSIEASSATPSAQAGVSVKETRQQTTETSASATQEIKAPVKEKKVEVAQAEVIQPEGNENSQLHAVTSGQTLFAISKLYNISVSQIRLWNNLQDRDEIKIGQILKVSGPSETNIPAAMPVTEFDVYTVQSGDTLYKIAKLYAVSVQELQDWNEKKGHSVAIGEKLKIKKSR
jgi:membrane-bound lytic murein transglycosylase D